LASFVQNRGGLALFVQNPEPAAKEKMNAPVFSLAACLPSGDANFQMLRTANCRTNPIPQTDTLSRNSRLGFNSADTTRAGLTAWLSSTTRWGYEYRCDGTAAASLDQRYYASTYGRFVSPDPYRASGGPANPQSWNRYAYVAGDPINFYDPHGRNMANPGYCPAEYENCDDDPGGGGGGGGDGGGGGGGGCPAGTYFVEAENDCEPDPYQPPGDPKVQCDITLFGYPAETASDPFVHTYLVLSATDSITFNSQTAILEAGPAPKTNPSQPASLSQVMSGSTWLNSALIDITSGGGKANPGNEVYDFRSTEKYSDGTLCSMVARLISAYDAYRNGVVTYSMAGPNSNTFTAYMLHQAGISLPPGVVLNLLVSAPGFFSQMPPHP
jgi:RHS repeat-associated protein